MKRTPLKRTPFKKNSVGYLHDGTPDIGVVGLARLLTKLDKANFNLAFPKPSQIKKEPEVEHVYRDGRTKLNQLTKAGRDEYQRRKRVAWEAQGKLCAICKNKLKWSDATVDHIKPRGMGAGSIDDRQENIQAVHATCNCAKGSRRDGLEDLIP